MNENHFHFLPNYLRAVKQLLHLPFLLYSDKKGNIQVHPHLLMSGRTGRDAVAPSLDEFIELPAGSELMMLPGRKAVGFDKKTGEAKICEEGYAVAAFMAPAHTMFYMAAFEKEKNAETLPLYAYAAVGYFAGKYYVPAVRIDKDERQDPEGFDWKIIKQGVKKKMAVMPDNRLLKHLAENCALTYCCPAARNLFMDRYECPIPSSPACNSNCIGCISFQPEEETIPSSQDRLTFKPTAEEIAQIAIPHLENVPDAVVSFGQGCEGEPLLMWDVIRDAIKMIRKKTSKGILNINTNASAPKAVEHLCKAGLQSIRVSMNSAQEWLYNAYYLPNNYKFEALAESIRVVRRHNGWASINYFAMPGVTDSIAEYEALRKFIRETGLTMIQWRNFNIDPDWYFEKVKMPETGEAIGMKTLMKELKKEFPYLDYGYFNPPEKRIQIGLKKIAEMSTEKSVIRN